MTIKTAITTLGIFALFLVGCSGSGDNDALVQEGIKHMCNIEKYGNIVSQDPYNEEAKAILSDAKQKLDEIEQSVPANELSALQSAIFDGSRSCN